ncbi:type II secretory protein pull [Pseudomonas sp. SWRI74]|uniref:Type II secretion system protein L n=1 Tax=Pseudomonas azerbaijanoccidentalis TaxID=2842347 RepID=A0ABS6QUE0_9PSED|nr:type II secretion system protein GspL [Pseudomonas azerbaijanoccidentalis]MBV4522534.1 type II secretory protein pull [Pseudomonas azerbaijanoccidentalis]
MKNWLYLTPEGLAAPTMDWPCCTWSETGQRQPATLNHAAQSLKGQPVDVLLPMELCSWLCSEPWPSRRAPDARTLAFAIEEQLSETLERLHLSMGSRDSLGRYPLMVIGRERFAAVLALLAEGGIEVRSVCVDADVLPCDQAIGVWWFGRWLLGGALPARLTLTEDALVLMMPHLPSDIQWRDERYDTVETDSWLRLEHGNAINLLQGDFAPRRLRMPWRLGGLAMLMIALLNWGASETRIRFLDSESRQLYSRSEQQFKALYPQQTRIVDLSAQLKALQGQGTKAQDGRVAGLVKLVEQVIGASNVEVQRIEFREGDGWRIQLTANNFAELEQLRERGRQQGMTMRVDSSNKARQRVQATLTVEQGA